MPQALLVGIGVFSLAALYFVLIRIGRIQAKQDKIAATSWKKADQVGQLITLYLDMVLKYGPKSDEAKSFRFGVTNSELWGGERNSEALVTFDKIAEYFDEALLRNKKMFRWH